MSMQTPRLSDHARQRCAEMKVNTKVAKRVWQNRSVCREDVDGRLLVTSVDYPDWLAVVARAELEDPVIVTLLRRTDDWTEER